MGAAALIASGGGSVWGRAMSARPIIWIGGISYGIYLWHWPIMVLWPGNVANGYGLAAGSLIIALSIAFAAVTKRFLEDPIRYSKALRRYPGRSLVGGLILAATALMPVRLATRLAR